MNIPLRDMNGRVSHAHDAPPEEETGGRGEGMVGEGAGSGYKHYRRSLEEGPCRPSENNMQMKQLMRTFRLHLILFHHICLFPFWQRVIE